METFIIYRVADVAASLGAQDANGLQADFVLACSEGNLAPLRVLLDPKWGFMDSIHKVISEGFRSACRGGHLGVVEALLELQGEHAVDANNAVGEGFALACLKGHLKVAQTLLALQGLHHMNALQIKKGFRWACWGGHLGVMRHLLALEGDRRIDVNADDEDAFHTACISGHLSVVQELLNLEGDRRIDVHGDELIRAVYQEYIFNEKASHLNMLRFLLSLTGQRAPSPDVIIELGLQELRNDVMWAGRPAGAEAGAGAGMDAAGGSSGGDSNVRGRGDLVRHRKQWRRDARARRDQMPGEPTSRPRFR